MRILVTGAAGMLGTSMVPILRKQGHTVYPTDIDLEDPSIEYLDIRETSQIDAFSRKVHPDLVAHLAAKTDVELCEMERDDAYRTNVVGTENVARACLQHGIPLVYISTAGVFDGMKREPYVESDKPNPVNYYGKTKFEGEKLVQQLLKEYYIVRAGWMMGGGLMKDKKFVAKVIKQIDAGRKIIYSVVDKKGTPTYTKDFSDCICSLVKTGNFGIYHMVCNGNGTRFDVASEILRILGREDVAVKAVKSDFFAKEYFAPRPNSETLWNGRLKSQGLDGMRHWKHALKDYLSVCFSDRFAR